MQTIGMVGGLGPEASIDYYRLLLGRARALGATEAPRIVIVSLDPTVALGMAGAQQWTEMADYLVGAVDALAGAGSAFAFLSANTAHVVFDEVRERSTIPLVSIVEAAAGEAVRRGFSTVGLLGTRFTMEGQFYPDVCRRRGVAVVMPRPEERDYVHQKYVQELIPGRFLDETRAGVLRVIESMRDRDGIQAVILGGTELPLLLRDAAPAVPYLDTTQIHVEAILQRAIGGSG
ncbi:MAG TPA: amino acid racemase [Vicinamibacterales bacterium]|nr:amino acid racemase [Vicinamibacterales bacterium]